MNKTITELKRVARKELDTKVGTLPAEAIAQVAWDMLGEYIDLAHQAGLEAKQETIVHHGKESHPFGEQCEFCQQALEAVAGDISQYEAGYKDGLEAEKKKITNQNNDLPIPPNHQSLMSVDKSHK